MAIVFIISHPEVEVDPARPVTRWSLSDLGIARLRSFLASRVLDQVTSVFSSTETKAIEAAGLVAGRLGLGVSVRVDLGENDRSATGYVPPYEFERLANAFFSEPTASVAGWERAVDAQARIAEGVEAVVAGAPPGDIAILTHGGVGTLLLCRYLGEPIHRRHDQPFQGHVWAFDRTSRAVLHRWRPIAPRR